VENNIRPMGANALSKDKRDNYLDDPNYIGECKFDGSRYVLQIDKDNKVYLTSRRESVDGSGMVDKTKNVPHIIKDIQKLKGIYSIILDGEIDIAGDKRNFKYVQGIMGSLCDRAIQLQTDNEWLIYKCFDILEYNREDLRCKPLKLRRKILEQILDTTELRYIKVVEQFPDKRKLLEEEIKKGNEGIMLKNLDSIYVEGKKPSQTWYKVKRKATFDGIVKGYKLGTPGTKYEKMLGTLTIYQYLNGQLIETSEIGGLTEEERIEFKKRLDKGETFIVEFEAQEAYGNNRYRHPHFLRLREDKNPSECIYGKS